MASSTDNYRNELDQQFLSVFGHLPNSYETLPKMTFQQQVDDMTFDEKLTKLKKLIDVINNMIYAANRIDTESNTTLGSTKLFIGPNTTSRDGILNKHGEFIGRMDKAKMIVQSLLTHNRSRINDVFYATMQAFLKIYGLWNTKKKEYQNPTACAVGSKKSNKGSCTIMGGKRKHTRKKNAKGRKSLKKKSKLGGNRRNSRNSRNSRNNIKKKSKRRNYTNRIFR